MKIVVASRNRHKIAELGDLLAQLLEESVELLSLNDVSFDEEIEEDGETFLDNARIKAQTVARATGLPALGDDSGLCVRALNGAPGVYSARFAGTHGDDAANNALLLQRMETADDRSAYFACALVLSYPDGGEIAVEGRADGTILHAPRGTSGFGYDPLFHYDPLGKTFSEMSAAEKNAVSHRNRAVLALAKILNEQKGAGKCIR